MSAHPSFRDLRVPLPTLPPLVGCAVGGKISVGGAGGFVGPHAGGWGAGTVWGGRGYVFARVGSGGGWSGQVASRSRSVISRLDRWARLWCVSVERVASRRPWEGRWLAGEIRVVASEFLELPRIAGVSLCSYAGF